ncbi:hypothetical protein OPV22_025328 [Ensete ventricosum]|uniref:Uncharacterized protein n=1 Tax=Ensete ventricosum TaxID=4639 RepID=A0AAV8P845_ENSVE|nr:hypothetical protein OPV22_025328 [Ensete ventricosum]
MEWQERALNSLLCLLLVGSVVTPVVSRSLQEFSEQNNLYPLTRSHKIPDRPTPSVGAHGTPTPSHGSPTPGGAHSSPVVKPPSAPTGSHTPPFNGTCKYWGSHPDAIVSVIGSLGTVGDFFGHGCAAIFGSNPSLHDALTNTRTDGYGELFREGTAALLNSMTDCKYPFTTKQVKSSFAGSIASDGAAAAQADIFKQANEGKF